jgi:hypothetical protein
MEIQTWQDKSDKLGNAIWIDSWKITKSKEYLVDPNMVMAMKESRHASLNPHVMNRPAPLRKGKHA